MKLQILFKWMRSLTNFVARYNNASYKIDDIDWTMNPESTFTTASGETISFVEYYKRQYQIEIQDPKQPLLINRPKKKALSEAESADRIICLGKTTIRSN